MCADIKICMGALSKTSQKFIVISPFGLNDFLDIEEDVFEEAVRLFHANLIFPKVPEGVNPLFNPIFL